MFQIREIYFLTILKLEVGDQSAGSAGFFWGLSLLIYRCPSSPYILTCLPFVSVLLSFLLGGYQSYWIKVYPNNLVLAHLFKDPISKYRHVLRFWGLGFQYTNFVGDTILYHNASVGLTQLYYKINPRNDSNYQCLQCERHSCGPFYLINLLNTHCIPMRQVIWSFFS